MKWYNAGAKADGFYSIEDMQVMEDNPDMVEFSWIIKGSITTAPGRLQFSLIFIDVDTVDLLKNPSWIKYQEEYNLKLFCEEDEAQRVLSSD